MIRFLRILQYFLAVVIGLYPILVFFMQEDQGILGSKSSELLRDILWRTGFYTHITLGGIALLSGVTQFNSRMRERRLNRHRLLGKIYVVACLLSGLSGLYIAQFATGGWMARLGFTFLALAWIVTTWNAWRRILDRDIESHRRWMVRSYALTFAAVTLRLWIPLLTVLFGMEFMPAYQLISWLCWLPNLILVEWWIRRMMPVQLR